MESRPDIYGYVDYRTWLRDWFEWKKTIRSTYSHRLFARMAGQRSPSTLIQVIDGARNLSDTALEGFVKALDLDAGEERFFRDLVRLEQGATPVVRSQALERILATQRFVETRSMGGELTRVLSHWHGPAIFELAGCPDFRLDPAWIGARLDPPISEAEAAAALDLLLSVGMLRRTDDGVRREAPRFGIPQPVHRTAALRYQAMLRLASRGLETFDEKRRYVSGLPRRSIRPVCQSFRVRWSAFSASSSVDAKGKRHRPRPTSSSLAFFPLSSKTTTEPSGPRRPLSHRQRRRRARRAGWGRR